jgi:ssDNA-binding Zn-finger/Zn-ribbon topoisomerase 1
MKSPILLEGPAFDWAEGEKHGAQAVDDDGNVNWMAAMFADPGCMKCPGCSEYLWREGYRVRCPDCGHEWVTQDGERAAAVGRGGPER